MNSAMRILHLMGTVIQLRVEHPTPDVLLNEAEKRLISYEKRFSANASDSVLMSINQHAGIKAVHVDEELFELIALGVEQSQLPQSLLNIAVGPLIQEWRIGFEDARVPSHEKIHQLLSLVDPTHIQLNQETQDVYLEQEGMSIDLGGLAKGFFADKIRAYFVAMGAKSGCIDLGGNVLTFGEAPNHRDGLWRIGLQNPFLPRGNYVEVVKIRNHSIVTSGIYERKLEWQGEHYHHIFDSQTGYPVKTDLASLTILSEQSVDGEIWTTRLFGRSAQEAMQTIERQAGIEGIVITTEGQIAYSNGMKQWL